MIDIRQKAEDCGRMFGIHPKWHYALESLLTSFRQEVRSEAIEECAATVEVVCICYARSEDLRARHSSECPIYRTAQIKDDILALKSPQPTEEK